MAIVLRDWSSGTTPGFQPGNRGSNPRSRTEPDFGGHRRTSGDRLSAIGDLVVNGVLGRAARHGLPKPERRVRLPQGALGNRLTGRLPDFESGGGGSNPPSRMESSDEHDSRKSGVVGLARGPGMSERPVDRSVRVTLRESRLTTIPRPGIEPGLAASKTAVRPTHSQGLINPILIRSVPIAVIALARSRTWSATFGGSRANPSHSKGNLKRDLRENGCRPIQGRSRITPAEAGSISRGARIRTLCTSFGGSLLSQEHTPL